MADKSNTKPDDSEEETPWHQAIREMPQDIVDAYNPTALQNNAGLMYDSLKHYLDPQQQAVLQPQAVPQQTVQSSMNQDQGIDPELFAKLKAQLQGK